jgi:hypothetical protein
MPSSGPCGVHCRAESPCRCRLIDWCGVIPVMRHRKPRRAVIGRRMVLELDPKVCCARCNGVILMSGFQGRSRFVRSPLTA